MMLPICMGTAGLTEAYAGRPGLPRAEAAALVRYAYERGIRWFDTAPAYGEAESVLGEALEGREDVRIGTKFTTHPGAPVAEQLRASLTALRRDRVDFYLAHNGTRIEALNAGLLDELRDLREQGWIGGAGVSVNDPYDAHLVALAPGWDAVQAPFHLIHPDRMLYREAFQAAAAKERWVLARQPLARGDLAFMAEAAIRWAVNVVSVLSKGSCLVVVGLGSREEVDVAIRACR